MKWKINDESCSHVAQTNILIFFNIFKKISGFIFSVRYKKDKQHGYKIKTQRKEKSYRQISCGV